MHKMVTSEVGSFEAFIQLFNHQTHDFDGMVWLMFNLQTKKFDVLKASCFDPCFQEMENLEALLALRVWPELLYMD